MLGRTQREEEIKRAFGIETGDSRELTECLRKSRELYMKRDGLGLAASICAELARLTTIEMKVKIGGSKRGEYLNDCVGALEGRLRRELELGLADGYLAIKPYFDGEKIAADIVRGECFLPISWDGEGNVRGAVFTQELKKEDVYYTRLEYHRFENGIYKIDNAAFKSKIKGSLGQEIPMSQVEEWRDLAQSVALDNVKKPLFGIFRTPSAGGENTFLPLGQSVYEKSAELIKQADELYKNLLWEFESGKRRLYVDVTAFERDSQGRPKLPDTELYRTIDVSDSGFFSQWSPEFRNEAIQSGLNEVLRRIEFNCSIAYGTLSEVSYVEKTAEEIKTSKQRSYCYVCDLQRQLKTAIEDFIYGADVWASVYSLAPMGEYQCSFEFDDSIMADRNKEYDEKIKLLEMGIMQPWEMRAWYFGEEEAAARKAVGQ